MMPRLNAARASSVALMILLSGRCAIGQAPADDMQGESVTVEFEMQIPAGEPWTATGLRLEPGDTIELHATPDASGSVHCDPEGVQLATAQQRDLPLKQLNPGSLIAKFTAGYAEAFPVGREARFSIATPGQLFLGTNTDGDSFCSGEFRVTAKLTFVTDLPVAKSTLQQLLDRLPRRVTDAQGNPGDMVNLVFLGDSPALLQTLADAKWVLVDRAKTAAAINAIMATYSHENYLEMPMSELYLLGRPQDYGFAMAQAYKVVASRHHFRVWKTGFLVNGMPLWLGAGTHDIGFEKDRRSGHLTHKIDPEIDKERDFIRDSVVAAHLNLIPTYVLPQGPFISGTNATGGVISSDGRLVVFELRARDPVYRVSR